MFMAFSVQVVIVIKHHGEAEMPSDIFLGQNEHQTKENLN
jgi:hypothetical protein